MINKKELENLIRNYGYEVAKGVYEYCNDEYVELQKENDFLKDRMSILEKDCKRYRELANRFKKEKENLQRLLSRERGEL
jgi:5-bromo-4-chloroindolyl phosphate hydrolysis protein